MTDISDWPSLIHLKAIKRSPEEVADMNKYFPSSDNTFGPEYAMIPMDTDGYQLGNLLWYLWKHPEDSTGDWYYEIIAIIEQTCIKLEIIPHANRIDEKDVDFNRSIEFIKKNIEGKKNGK